MQNNFQIVSDWLYAINKYITVHNYKSIVDPLWLLSGVIMGVCLVGMVAEILPSQATIQPKKFLKDVKIYGIAFIISAFSFILLFFGELYFDNKLTPIQDHNPKVVQKATNNLNHLYKKLVYIDDNRQIYLYFTNDTNKINSIRNLSNNSITLNSDDKNALVSLSYDSTNNQLESYCFVKTSITISGNEVNDIKIFDTNNVSISKILLE